MRVGIGKAIGLLAVLGSVAALMPASAAARPGVNASVWTVHGSGVTASAAINILTINDQRRIDNRINAFIGATGRLTLTAPEGLGDPDGAGPYCALDNAKAGESSATEVSCEPGYIGALVGDLGAGADTFDADPGLTVMVGAVIDGQQRPLYGGSGRDRLVGGLAADFLDGGGAGDSVFGAGGQDLLVGGSGPDNLGGGAANDVLLAGGGADKLGGGAGRDLCRGAGGMDRG